MGYFTHNTEYGRHGMRVSTSVLQNSFGKYLKLAAEGTSIYIEKNNEPVALLRVFPRMKDGCFVRRRGNIVQSYADFREIAERNDNGHQYELIDGEIYMMRASRYYHQKAVGELFGTFITWFRNKPCQPIVAPFDVKLFGKAVCFDDKPNVVQPDILIMCDEERVDEEGRYQGKPSLVVEVLSPSTRSKDMMIKSKLYMESGIEEFWVVDPKAKQVIIYHFRNRDLETQVTFRNGETALSSLYQGLAVETGLLFV